MRKLLMLTLLSFLVNTGFASVATAASELDSTAWRIQEKGKTDTEDLVFIEGKFLSSGCVPYGFLLSTYNSIRQGGMISFTSIATNQAKETMDWKGSVKGKTISGTYVYTDKGGKKTTAEWEGKKLEAK